MTSEQSPTATTLGILLDTLGTTVLRPLLLPRGRERAVGHPLILDPDANAPHGEDPVILAPGRPSADLLDWAANVGASALVVRPRAMDPSTWGAAARRTGVAVLECAPDVAWGRLYTLIDAIKAMSGPVSDADGHSADLFGLANDIALRTGGAVAIEDLAMRVLAYSTIPGQEVDELRRDGILGRRVPDHPANAEEYAAVLRATTAVRSLPADDNRPRLAIAVRDRGEALGSIWVLEGSVPLAPDSTDVLAEAARNAAAQLARFNLVADADRRQRAERLAWLLRGSGATHSIAEHFGLDVAGPATVVMIDRPRDGVPHTDVSTGTAAAYVGDLLRTSLSAYRIPAAAGAFEGRAMAVAGTSADTAVLQSVIGTVLARATESLGPGWRAGVSRTQQGLADVPTAVRQAAEAWRVVARMPGHGDIGRHEHLGPGLVLMDLHAALLGGDAVGREPLATLLAHDAAFGTDYVTSMRRWIGANYDVARAAELLMLHPNTLRHRLRRIGEIVDVDDADVRLVLALQLRLRDIEPAGV
ncbi:CdaR family transcriptional regulator [Microbacterium sp. p3-SID336]|uniref:PucR family transcriptional regulator n=1 Tax=Microbacterium sp. p3-SID336 TaxID=2916212 RepID=UPI0021A8D9DB|nr:PucR family transcriptional regulator [Microbacterium sp. p3-SID336]MCT1477923.1 helix-turn-helix domain-containing protein [Microbacterium sp. p3-SID336]